jgi:hypothetical protein
VSPIRRFFLIALCLVTPAGTAFAQAEPAPPEYVPPGHEPESPPPPPSPIKWHIGVGAHLVVPLAALPPALPQEGWGAAVNFTRALINVGRMRFGLGADFGYGRVQHDKYNSQWIGPSLQFVSHTTVAGLLVLDGIFDRLRPWLTAGGGFSIAQYTDPHLSNDPIPSVELVRVVPLLQFAAGLGVRVWRNLDVGLGTQIDLTFSSDMIANPPRTFFSPGAFVLRLDVGFRL